MARGGKKANGGGELGYEAKLWQMAAALRNNMDAAEYEHVVLGLIFLKQRLGQTGDFTQALLPDRGERAA